ncbi:MAG TPA: NAD-dependent succinate-semialdehyde dehydrogenase [Hypericibacter adhaerens]|uniref:NAD-dependent succinate-semialdehyde dehydrogenase n=1 Tax=Hypericibacter adhaerens TaxID=2602016 RepID=UPI002CD3C7F0|nr:NAD-dependent succinate-semialdehyde dehydrogenase [Hypericibacter adhaerens]HWA46380.1 NAD-dependent succinate-semialdehyde dehydrogenase [Hypericibacter adhaerens]
MNAERGRDIQLLIDGEFRAGSSNDWLAIVNPATEATVGRLAVATKADLDRALAAAARGFAQWRTVSPFERSKLLRRAGDLIRSRADGLAEALTAEQGKPLAEARIEIMTCGDILDWYAEEGRRTYGRTIPARLPGVTQIVTQEPIGPVAAFSPWNFPASQAMRKIAGALAAGCSIIIKPPEEAPSAALAFGAALTEAGVPAGVVNIVFGRPAEISEHLIPSPIIRKVSFTGSVPVGKHLAQLAGAHMKPATMELGGHAPVLVFDDVDPAKAAQILVGMKFRNAGQVCVSPTRFYVQGDSYRPFLKAFAGAAQALRVGEGRDPQSQMGPLANRRRLDAVESLVNDAVADGAKVATGGKRIGNRGYFYAPTVLTDLPASARILSTEPFGPVALIQPFGDPAEAIEKANATSYGLASYAFTKSSERAALAAGSLQSGMVGINHFGVGLIETPFGGIKDSGYGHEGGSEGLAAYLVKKFVSQAPI